MKTWKKYLIALFILALAALAFYFKVYIPKTTFEVQTSKIGSLDAQVFGIGTVNAKEIYTISSQVGGKITDILTDEGMWIKKDALLAVIDPVDLPLLLQEAEVSLQKAKYESIALKKEIESLNAQKTLAQITYNRYEKLFAQKYAAKAEFDKATADLQSINAQIASSNARIDSSTSEVQRAQKNIEALDTKLSRLKIYAPIDGYVISKDAQISQTVVPAQAIVKVVDTKSVWIKAYIDERISANVKVGQNAAITLRSQSDKTFFGHVARISSISDALTQEREVTITFDALPIPFYINEQAQVQITTQVFDKVFTFPATLLTQEKAKQGVWVAKNQTAHFEPLDIVVRSNNLVGVKSGVDESTKIIVLNPNKKPLSEGMKIQND